MTYLKNFGFLLEPWDFVNKALQHDDEASLRTTMDPVMDKCIKWKRILLFSEMLKNQGTHFFWTMLRSSLQLWQSWSCAKLVIGRQLDRKDWSVTWKQKKNTKPTAPTNKPTPKNPQVLTNLWKGETGETGSRSHYLVHKILKNPGSHNLFSIL